MPRAKSGVAHHRRVKKALKRARGYRGAGGRLHRLAVEMDMRGAAYAYRHRRNRKREFRALWITRLTAACRQRGISYSRFIGALRRANIALNRKMLSEIAIHDPAGFDRVVGLVKPHLERTAA
jgi:large subunit ribosomal protein L20